MVREGGKIRKHPGRLSTRAHQFSGVHVTINCGRNAWRNRGFTESRWLTGSKLSESREDALLVRRPVRRRIKFRKMTRMSESSLIEHERILLEAAINTKDLLNAKAYLTEEI